MLSSWFCDIFVYSFFDKYLFSPDIENRVISWVKFADDKKVGVFEYHTFPLCASLQDDDDDVYNGDYYVDAVDDNDDDENKDNHDDDDDKIDDDNNDKKVGVLK